MTRFIGWLDGREIPTDQYASIQRAGPKFLHWVFELHPADAPFYLQTQIELHAWDYWSHLRTDQARTIDLTGDLTDAGRALGWLWLYAQTTHGRHAPAITTRSARLNQLRNVRRTSAPHPPIVFEPSSAHAHERPGQLTN